LDWDWSAELDIKIPCKENFHKQTSNAVLQPELKTVTSNKSKPVDELVAAPALAG
jgi:hypothetical protein